MNFNGTVKQKIDDLVAEYGLDRAVIRYIQRANPCAFAIYGYYYVTLVAENEVEDLCRWLVNEKLYASYDGEYGFLTGAPVELLDKCSNPLAWSPVAEQFYREEAEGESETPVRGGGYPNRLAYNCVRNEIITDEDLDRYFNSNGEWLDSGAKGDLVNKYVEVMTARALKRPCSWYIENVVPYDSRRALRERLCKRKSLINRKVAVEEALEWMMDRLGVATHVDFLAQYFAPWDRKVHEVGEFHAFFAHDPKFLRMDPQSFTLLDMLGLDTKGKTDDSGTATITEEETEPGDFDFSCLTDREVDRHRAEQFTLDLIVCDSNLPPEKKCFTIHFPAVGVDDALNAIEHAMREHPSWFPAHLFRGTRNVTHQLSAMLFNREFIKLEPINR